MRKRTAAFLLALVLALGCLTGVNAADIRYSGSCGAEGDGTNLTWTLDYDGVLTISGTGVMADYPLNTCMLGNHKNLVTTVVLNPGVTSIGVRAFSDNLLLTSITIPDSVTSIGEQAFYNCYELSNVTIPNSVTNIGSRAFFSTSLTSVTIPNSMTSISGAFAGCLSLTSVTIPNSVTSIGDDAFAGCSSLTSITIPDSVTSIGKQAFYNCYELSNVTIPNSVTNIDSFAFERCFALTSVAIPDSVTTIGRYAFSQCTNLTSVMIPKSVTSIRDYAFEQTSLQDVYYAGRANDWAAINIETYNLVLTNARIHYLGETPASQRTPTVSTVSSGTRVRTAKRTAKSGTKTVYFNAGLYAEDNKLTEMEIAWSIDLFNNVSSEYNNDLAIAGLVLSANAEDTSAELVEDTLRKLGFTDIVSGNYDGYHGDNDKVGYTIARTSGGSDHIHRTNYVAVVCRGSVGGFDDADWQSNLNSREDGFERAAENVMNGDAYAIGLNDYISQYVNTTYPVKVFITGHSRGGAVANDLAVKVEKEDYISSPSNVFVYTYACPNTTPSGQATDIRNIFNIINVGDQVPNVPWFVNKRGVRIEFDKERINGKLDNEFFCLTGKHSSVIDFPGIVYVEPCFGGYAMNDYPIVSSAVRNHSPAIYMAYLISNSGKSPTINYQIKRVSVKCPVDVYVYDAEGNCLGSVINNEADDELLSKGFHVEIEGDEKYIYMPPCFDVRIELSATGSGTMTYSVEEIDGETGLVNHVQTFTGVALSDGKTMVSAIAEDIAAEDTQLFVRENGKITTEIDAAGNETEVVILSFDVGLGDPVRDVAVPLGAAAGTLPVTDRPGYSFGGWYADKELTEAFDPAAELDESMTLYAKFTPRFDVYGYFSAVTYDGETLTATLAYDYNARPSLLYAALYQEGKLIALGSADAPGGAASVTVSMPVSDLYGVYELRAYSLDSAGTFLPLCDCAEVSFIAN